MHIVILSADKIYYKERIEKKENDEEERGRKIEEGHTERRLLFSEET